MPNSQSLGLIFSDKAATMLGCMNITENKVTSFRIFIAGEIQRKICFREFFLNSIKSN